MLKAGGVCRNYEHRSRKVFIEQKMCNAILGLDSGLIQAQLKLADAIRKLAEHAERNGIELDMDVQVQNLLGIHSADSLTDGPSVYLQDSIYVHY